MLHLLWKLFEENGEISAYLFYKRLEDTDDKKKNYRIAVEPLGQRVIEK